MADKLSGQAQSPPPEDARTLARRFAEIEKPAWLWNPRRNRIVWGNAAAVRFWDAGSALDLIEYRFLDGSPEAKLGNGLRGGAERETVLAPSGAPLLARVRAEDAMLFDGSEGVLVCIVETLPPETDPATARKAALFESAPVALLTLDATGAVIEANMTAQEFVRAIPADGLAKLVVQALTQGSANRSLTITVERETRAVRLFAQRRDDMPEVIVRIDDVTERRALETEVLQAASSAKTSPEPVEHARPKAGADFVANLSHEMRNPLNAILGFSEIMQQRRFGPLGNHRYEGYIDDIHMSAAHLLALVNDLLDLGRLSSGQFKIAFESVSLAAIAGECGRMLNLQAAEMGVALEIDVPSRLPPVVADARAMRQLLLNVMSNAVKFTPEGGAVQVTGAATRDGGVVLRVADTGIGMTEDELARAMKPYGQIEGDLQRRRKGAGLGLPLAKALADANKCSFRITSVPQGGTQVEIAFSSARVLAG
ncbi:MAG TPA: HAMP domain-containing sensor histidine kinase [Rhizomicrobium sp.]|jgi:signal transduction histidine kinase